MISQTQFYDFHLKPIKVGDKISFQFYKEELKRVGIVENINGNILANFYFIPWDKSSSLLRTIPLEQISMFCEII
jgi:rRNA processing protein Gar1